MRSGLFANGDDKRIKMAGIYIHVPFCKSKCTYCDFASYPDEIGKAEAYFACLYKEMRSRAEELKGKSFDTVYFGGGTPSFVDPKYVLGCMRLIKEKFSLADGAEITLEVNPGTIDRNKLRVYKEAGITRYSLGLQSADDKMLRRLNRIHNKYDFLAAADMLKGYELSVDVMIGLFDQTETDVRQSIDLAIAGGADHISVYALTPEEGTPMYGNYLNGDLPDADEVASLYDFGVRYLKEKGFLRYEVSNFCKPGHESRHNSNYWRRGEYIGFGVSASSFIGGRRFTNTERIDEYVHCLLNGKYAEVYSEKIEGKDAKDEFVMLSLRTTRGIVKKEYSAAFGSEFDADYANAVKNQSEYLIVTNESVRIKDEYLYVQNSVIVGFMEQQ